jgi:hypothetical protein
MHWLTWHRILEKEDAPTDLYRLMVQEVEVWQVGIVVLKNYLFFYCQTYAV